MLYAISFRTKGDSDRVVTTMITVESDHHPEDHEIQQLLKEHVGDDAVLTGVLAHPEWDADERERGGSTIYTLKK
jgi:hypothetical protein